MSTTSSAATLLLTAFATVAVSSQPPVTSPPAQTAVSAKLPVEAFVSAPFVEKVDLSPDGTRMAGVTSRTGSRSILIQPLFSKTEKPLLATIPDETEVDSVEWVNDDNVVVRLRVLKPIEGENWYVTRLIAINRLATKITQIKWDLGGQNGADILWTAKDGSPEIIFAGQNTIYSNEPGFWPAVFRVNVETGKAKKIVESRDNVMDWVADGNGDVRSGFAFRNEGRSFQLLYRPPGNAGLFKTIDRANTSKRESLTAPFMFLPNGDDGLVYEDDEKGRTVISLYNVSTLTKEKVFFDAPAGEVTGAIASADGMTLIGVHTSDFEKPLIWLDPQLSELQAQFDKAVSHGRARIVSFSKDRQRMLVQIEAADMAGALYFYDVADGRLQRIAHLNDRLKSQRLSPVKRVQYKARDGLQIEGLLTLPAGRPTGKLPFILMPHGGPWAHDAMEYDYWAQFLANRGYAVLQPNFRGSTGYGTEFLRKGEGQMGLAMQDDLNDAVKWAVSNDIADANRVCIVGASYGGYVSMWGIARDPDLYRCAISIAGVADLRREVNDFGGSLLAGKYKEDWQRMTPDFKAVSPLGHIDKIKVPLLLVHGKKDVTVDHRQSQLMNERMIKAGKSVEFVSLPLADHYFTRQDDRIKLLAAMEGFLARHNPAN